MKQAWAHFFRHIEIYLSLIGLLIVWIAGVVAARTAANEWQVMALVSVAVASLHGVIFWAVRSRERWVRRDDMKRARVVLQDVINNQLMVINLAVSADDKAIEAMEQVQDSLRTISAFLARFSEESVSRWESQQLSSTLALLRGGDSVPVNPD